MLYAAAQPEDIITRNVNKRFNIRDLSVLRRVKKSPLLKIFMTVEGFSAGKIEFTAGYFSRLPAIFYIPELHVLNYPLVYNTLFVNL